MKQSDTNQLLFSMKVILAALLWPAAVLADEIMRNVDPATLPWWTWAFITAFASVGWAIAELDKMADIIFPEGLTPRARLVAALKFSQGYLASGFAGVGIYFIAKVSPGWIGMKGEVPEMIVLLLVTAGGYGGTRFLQWLLTRMGMVGATQS